MGELAVAASSSSSSSKPQPVQVLVDGERGVDLGSFTVPPSTLGFCVHAALRRSRRERRGGRSKRERKAALGAVYSAPTASEMTILLKRVPPADLAPPAAAPELGFWDYEAYLCDLQLQRERYHMSTAAVDPFFPPLYSCPQCDAAAASLRAPEFHCCVHDGITVGFRSPFGPIERPAKNTTSAPPPPAIPAHLPTFDGMLPV